MSRRRSKSDDGLKVLGELIKIILVLVGFIFVGLYNLVSFIIAKISENSNSITTNLPKNQIINDRKITETAKELKYVDDLIPDQFKVNINIDNQVYYSHQNSIEKVPNYTALLNIAALFFGVLFIVNISTRFYSGLFFLFIGLLFLPNIHKSIENLFRFKFYWKIKGVLLSVLLIFAILSLSGYIKKEQIIAENNRKIEQIRIEKIRIENERLEKIEKQRTDSLNYYTLFADSLFTKNQFYKAYNLYNAAIKFCNNDKFKILHRQGLCYFHLGKYKDAINLYTAAINSKKSDYSDILYERAICYLKLNKKQEAINDLKHSGISKANEMYEKLNPIIKEITGYNTYLICCDGTTSDAVGRQGACSRHGGVCRTVSEPIYREYRKYE